MARFDEQHPFFRPLWRRVAIVVFCLGWGAFELVSGAVFWGGLFSAVGFYLLWSLIIKYQPLDDTLATDPATDQAKVPSENPAAEHQASDQNNGGSPKSE